MTDEEQFMVHLHRTRPDFLEDGAHFDNEKVLGWALMTDHPHADVHSESDALARPIGYMIVTEGSYMETCMDGVPRRVKSLKMMEA